MIGGNVPVSGDAAFHRLSRPLGQPDVLRHREVLGDHLPGQGDLVVGCLSGAQLEQGLLVALCQGVQDRATGRAGAPGTSNTSTTHTTSGKWPSGGAA